MLTSMDFFPENPSMSCFNPNPNISSHDHNNSDNSGFQFCPNYPPIASSFRGSAVGSYHGDGGENVVGSIEESGCDDDPIMKYIDFSMIENDNAGSNGDGSDKIVDTSGTSGNGGSNVDHDGGDGNGQNMKTRRLNHHRHSCSMGVLEVLEPKKAMSTDKLAELWITDPKRAKRMLANRQSAARSKERKARYITELERKVSAIQKEADNLILQLSGYQREATFLYSENDELKLRLQTMQHQAQIRDDLNKALKQENDRLRMAAKKVKTPIPESFNLAETPPISLASPPRFRDDCLLPPFQVSSSSMTPCHLVDYTSNHPRGCVQWVDQINCGGYEN